MFDVHFLTPLVHGMEPTTADFRRARVEARGDRGGRAARGQAVRAGGRPRRRPRRPARSPRAVSARRGGVPRPLGHEPRPAAHVVSPRARRALAGFYEDPSAITKGWQANAVEFDHLLNQSSAAWALGAPSVVPLFAKASSTCGTACTPRSWRTSRRPTTTPRWTSGCSTGRSRLSTGCALRGGRSERALARHRARGVGRRARRLPAASAGTGQRGPRAQALRRRVRAKRQDGGQRRAASGRRVRETV